MFLALVTLSQLRLAVIVIILHGQLSSNARDEEEAASFFLLQDNIPGMLHHTGTCTCTFNHTLRTLPYIVHFIQVA